MFGTPLPSSIAVENNSSSGSTIPTPTSVVPTQVINVNQPNLEQPMILANRAQTKTFSLNKFNLDINFIFLLFLALTLILDFYVSIKLNVFRIGGKNIAHLIFIGFIILGLTLFTRGAIM